MATTRSDISETLQRQVRRLMQLNKAAGEALQQGEAAPWQSPEPLGWSGDLDDREGMAKAFSRDQVNDWFAEAIRDPASSGSTGDLIGTSAQVAVLSAMERAYRMRHQDDLRTLLFDSAAARGLGSPTGPLSLMGIEQLQRFYVEAKS